MSKDNFLDDLPEETVSRIHSFLKPNELLTVSQVSQKQYRIVNDNIEWKQRFERYFPGVDTSKLDTSNDTFVDYKTLLRQEFEKGIYIWNVFIESGKKTIDVFIKGNTNDFNSQILQLSFGRELSPNTTLQKNALDRAFLVACYYGRLGAVKNLIQKGANPATEDNHAIRFAAYFGHLEMVKYLISLEDKGVDPAAEDNDVIISAARGGQLEVVKYLMSLEDRGIDPATTNNYAIRLAAGNGHLEVAKELLKHPRVYELANNTNIIDSTIKQCIDEFDKVQQSIQTRLNRSRLC